ncbi:MAG: response regulator [Candidatus Methylomirabilales bacterium]
MERDTPTITAYCVHCRSVQPTFEFAGAHVPLRRCQICGFPVKTSPTLESEGALTPAAALPIKILCIDDQPSMLQMLTDLLDSYGYSVLTAPNGETGLEVAARERPDLILLEIMMPDMDGYDTCRLLKAEPATRAIPVIILTVLSDPRLNTRAFEAGAILALQKTSLPDVIIRTIESALAPSGPLPPSTPPAPDDPRVSPMSSGSTEERRSSLPNAWRTSDQEDGRR